MTNKQPPNYNMPTLEYINNLDNYIKPMENELNGSRTHQSINLAQHSFRQSKLQEWASALQQTTLQPAKPTRHDKGTEFESIDKRNYIITRDYLHKTVIK